MKLPATLLLLLPAFFLPAAPAAASDSFREALRQMGDEARKASPGAAPFRVQGILNPARSGLELTIHSAAFALPGDEVSYLQASYLYTDSHHRSVSIERSGYILGACGGIPLPDCGKPTGRPEPPALHAPLRKLRIDLPELRRILSRTRFEEVHYEALLTSLSRFRGRSIEMLLAESRGPVLKKLAALPADTPLLSLLDARGWAGMDKPNHLLIVNMSSGRVLFEGKVLKEPPRPGAVSSGGN